MIKWSNDKSDKSDNSVFKVTQVANATNFVLEKIQKYKSDKETKSEVTKSNIVSFVKNRMAPIAKGMLTGAHQAQVLKKEGYLKKVGKVAPSVLSKCGSKRKH